MNRKMFFSLNALVLISGSLLAFDKPEVKVAELQIEEVSLPSFVSGAKVYERRTDADAAFDLYDRYAEFRLGDGQGIEIPLNTTGMRIYNGQVDYVVEDGQNVFRYRDVTKPVVFLVQGYRFGLGVQGSLKGIKNPAGVWEFSTINGVSDGESVSSMEIKPLAPLEGVVGLSADAIEKVLDPVNQLRYELYKLPKEEIVLYATTLDQVFAYLARKSGINFVYGEFEKELTPVVITARAIENPFKLLEVIAAEHGYSVEPTFSSGGSDGFWMLRSLAQEGLIARAYKLKQNNQNVFEISSGASGSSTGFGSGTSINPGTNSNMFKVDSSKFLADIESLLELTEAGLVVDGLSDYTATEVDVSKELENLGVPKFREGNNTKPKSKVMLLSGGLNRVLFVIGTRQQHEWIRGYLRAFDTPRKTIAFEVKLVASYTSLDKAFGVRPPREVKIGIAPKDSEVYTTSGTATTNLQIPFSSFPVSGVLDASTAEMVFSALTDNASGSSVKYYVGAAEEGREFVLKDTQQRPILAASASVNTGGSSGGSSSSGGIGSGTSSQEVQYRDIGVLLNLRGFCLGDHDDYVQVAFMMENSSLGENVSIGGVPYPVPIVNAGSTVVSVKSGSSMAIGGFDVAETGVTRSQVPLLGSIPLLGRLFRYDTSQRPQRHLSIFITPVVQRGYATGVETMARGVYLGTWDGYTSGMSKDAADLQRRTVGIFKVVNDLESEMVKGNLNKSFMSDLNALSSDLASILRDMDGFSAKGDISPEAQDYRAQLLVLRDRIAGMKRHVGA